ncbi:MAG: hypothetical protein C0594_16425 [Marinilabiliales bacterium]|nr:MAG: hypothetical protein C0594_16425 [Marinilabiliales bacterium]
MKHQITLVGGQILPVYVGIKEFNPDKVHFLVSNDSKNGISSLKSQIQKVKYSEYICNPFDFYEIKSICEKIVEKIESEDEVSFNLTGGTKIMVLAAQSVIHEKNLQGFYINQDDTFLKLPEYKQSKINTEISIKEFFTLSGHNIFSYKELSDYTNNDFNVVKTIESFANTNKKYSSITNHFRRKYQKIPQTGKESLQNGVIVTWDTKSIVAVFNGKTIFNISSDKAMDLFFNAAWWELIVAQEVSKWNKIKEICLGLELPFKTDNKIMKNEIDLLINTGKKLFFIECKSGNVKQEDINKMKIIKQTYGGLISKSVLVSRYMVNSNILEKCKELDIEVFYSYAFNNIEINPVSKLITTLNNINAKGSI